MLETLKAYQAWRRGEDKRKLQETNLTPTVIGLAIDWAIEQIEAQQKGYDDLSKIIENQDSIINSFFIERESSLAKLEKLKHALYIGMNLLSITDIDAKHTIQTMKDAYDSLESGGE